MNLISLSLLLGILAPQDPRTATIQLPSGHTVTGAMLADINVDERMDLILACLHPNTGKRSLRAYLRQSKRGPAFSSAPSKRPLTLDPDVVAFTYADCAKEPGMELVLMTPELVVAVTESDSDTPAYQKLANHQLLWPAANQLGVAALRNAAVDFDADGRTDLLLPKPDGWSILFHDVADGTPSFARTQTLSLPRWESRIGKAVPNRAISAQGNSIRMRLGSQQADAGILVRTSTRTPKCETLDLDGNGMLDLVVYRNDQIYASMQRKAGEIATTSQPLPLPEKRLKAFDPAFDVQWADINQDGRADLLLTTSAQRDDDVESRVDVFLANEDGSWPNKPSSRLRMQQLARQPQMIDVDADGIDDLVCVTLRTSAMANLTNPQAASLTAQLTMYRNVGGAFVTPYLLSKQLTLTTDSRLSKPFLVVRPGRRGRPGDDLMHTDGHIERRFLNLKGKQLTMSKPDARTPVGDKASIMLIEPVGDDILILSDGEVRHVNFRR